MRLWYQLKKHFTNDSSTSEFDHEYAFAINQAKQALLQQARMNEDVEVKSIMRQLC